MSLRVGETADGVGVAVREAGGGGQWEHIESQVFEVLRYLLRHSHRAVPREELIEKVWEGRFVSDATVSARIASALHVIGDNGGRQEVLFTHLMRILQLDPLLLRGPNRARDDFLLAAIAQNLRKLATLVPALPAPA